MGFTFGYNNPMSLTLKEVEHIAELARLDLSDVEKEQYREQLSAILDYAQRLQEVDTTAIPPTSSVLPLSTDLREDIPQTGFSKEETLGNAPDEKDGQFKVPAVFE
jgi:aspartyl-tRNA(Asn)/glutamyl-tRNA(Gln) amidotransferase subunit C